MPRCAESRGRGAGRHQAVVPAPSAPLPALAPPAAFAPPPLAPAARAALSLRASRLRLRAAAFLWIVFFDATLSSTLDTSRSSVSALARSPPARAAVKLLTCVLMR